jgi:hypothetical protein
MHVRGRAVRRPTWAVVVDLTSPLFDLRLLTTERNGTDT